MTSRLLDFLYPALCELCQKSLQRGHSICASCAAQLPRIIEPFCQNCGETFPGNIQDPFECQNCLGMTHDFRFARASLKGLTQTFHLVHSLKYRRRFFIAKDLAQFLAETYQEDERFREFGDDTLLVPVPLHWRRERFRQGNQAYELARELAKITDLTCLDAMRRTRATNTQTKLNRKQRLSNLRRAFSIKKKAMEKLRGANVILIDDVFTTGATAHECTRILKHVGKASKVAILTLVRG